MKQEIQIIPFEEHEKVTFYSFIIDGNEDCEMICLMKKMIKDGGQKEASIISALIEKIGKNGAQERYFRYAGKPTDHVFELPDHYIAKTRYRLYCLRFGEVIVILGNGGIKKTRTYQEDENLNNCVEILKRIDQQIIKRMTTKQIIINGKSITGTLKFQIT